MRPVISRHQDVESEKLISIVMIPRHQDVESEKLISM